MTLFQMKFMDLMLLILHNKVGFIVMHYGAVVDSFQVGIIPGSFAFRQDVLGVSNLSTASVTVYLIHLMVDSSYLLLK